MVKIDLSAKVVYIGVRLIYQNIVFSETTRPIESKKVGKGQEWIQSYITPDPRHCMGK